MVCSNEPGYYEDGAFGIRIENLFVVKEADTAFRWAEGCMAVRRWCRWACAVWWGEAWCGVVWCSGVV